MSSYEGLCPDCQQVECDEACMKPQGGGEVVAWAVTATGFPRPVVWTCPDAEDVAKDYASHCEGRIARPLVYGDTAPPSAPVGVEGLVAKWRERMDASDHFNIKGSYTLRQCAEELEAALAQQPAAVDGDAAITRMCEAHYGVQFGYSKAARDKMRRLLTAALAQPQGASHD